VASAKRKRRQLTSIAASDFDLAEAVVDATHRNHEIFYEKES